MDVSITVDRAAKRGQRVDVLGPSQLAVALVIMSKPSKMASALEITDEMIIALQTPVDTAQVYVAVKRMLDRGLLIDEIVSTGRGRTTRYFKVTKEGEAMAEETLKVFERIASIGSKTRKESNREVKRESRRRL